MQARSALLAALAALVVAAPTTASATSCDFGHDALLYGGVFDENHDVPATIVPWTTVYCGWQSSECALVSALDTVPLTTSYGPCKSDRKRVTFTPERPLLVGATYALDCPAEASDPDYGFDGFDGRLTVVDGPAASAPDIALGRARITLEDDGCCADGGTDALEVDARLGSGAAAFFAQGGRIDVRTPTDDLGTLSRVDQEWSFPPDDVDHIFVPIAADGTEGPELRLDADAIRRDAVYIPCAIASQPGVPLSFFVPFLWLAAGRRRARPRA